MAESRRGRAHDEGVIVRPVVNVIPGPRVLLDVDTDLLHLSVRIEEVRAKQKRECLGRVNAVLFRHQVHRVLLAVCRDNVAIVTLEIILLGA